MFKNEMVKSRQRMARLYGTQLEFRAVASSDADSGIVASTYVEKRVVGSEESGGRGGRDGSGRGGIESGMGWVGIQGAGQTLVRHQVVTPDAHPSCSGGRKEKKN